MTTARPTFDEAFAFWRTLVREHELPDGFVWIFVEDAGASDDRASAFRLRSSIAGELLARRAYRSAPDGEALTFAAYASGNGHTVVGLRAGNAGTPGQVRRDDWNLLFDAACPVRTKIDGVVGDASLQARSGGLFSHRTLCGTMTEADQRELRHAIMQDLVLLTSPLSTIQDALKDLDAGRGKAWMLERRHILSILRRFDANEIAERDVQAWANAIETRNDIAYDRESAVWDVLYELANPLLTEPLTRERADVLASVLKGH